MRVQPIHSAENAAHVLTASSRDVPGAPLLTAQSGTAHSGTAQSTGARQWRDGTDAEAGTTSKGALGRRWSLARALATVTLCSWLALTACGEGGNKGAGGATAQGEGKGKDGAGKGGKGEGPTLPAVDADVVTPQQHNFLETIPLVGTLAADERSTVGTKVSGRLAEVLVDLGSPVRKGQVIARLETTDFQLRVEQAFAAVNQARASLGLPLEQSRDEETGAERTGVEPGATSSSSGASRDAVQMEETALVKEAKASLEQASLNLKRMESLADKNFVARAELEAARANFVKAESALTSARETILGRQALLQQRRIELRLAQQQLKDATLLSPLDGQVELRQAEPGEMLAVGAPVATVVRMNPLRLRSEVPEREAPKVRRGQALRVSVEGDNTTHEGEVVRLAPSITEQSRVLVVEAEIRNPGNLRPGSFVRGELIVSQESSAMALPVSAVVVFAGIEKVIAVEDGKAVEKRVETDRKDGDLIEISSGLKGDETIVASPGTLQQGQPVNVRGRQSPQEAEKHPSAQSKDSAATQKPVN